MNRCPITYELTGNKYSKAGLKLLSPKLTDLQDLAYTSEEQIREAANRAAKISIQEAIPVWYKLIEDSFLSADLKSKYNDLLEERIKCIYF